MELTTVRSASTTGLEVRTSEWLTWSAIAAAAAPAAIVLHELGHFVAARALGFSGVALHFASVSVAEATEAAPWQRGMQAAAGPLVTLAIVLLCCLAASRHGGRAWTIAPAFGAGVRSVAIGIAYLVAVIRSPGAQGNFDELNAARGFGLPPEAVVVVNCLLIIAAWAYLAKQIEPGRRLVRLSATLAGTFAGLAIYVGWLGPVLLP